MSQESSPRADAVDGSSSTRNTQGKRAACDRCRGQKLRCLRESRGGNADSSKCIRCNTAGAVCSFSDSKRAGRPPASTSADSTARRGRAKQAHVAHSSMKARHVEVNKGSQESIRDSRQKDGGNHLPLSGTSLNEEGDMDIGQISPADELLTQPLNPTSIPDTTWDTITDLPWIDEGVAAFYDRGNLNNLDTFVNEFGWSLPASSMGSQLNQVPTSTLINHNPLNVPLIPPDEVMSEPPPLTFASKSFDPTLSGDREKDLMDFSTMNFGIKPKELHELEIKNPTELPLVSNDAHQWRTQELSELSMSLYSQLIANEEYYQAQVLNGHLGPRENYVGNILKSSFAFLDILLSFYPSSSIKRSPSKTSVFESSDGDISPSEASNYSDFSDFGASTGASDRSSNGQWKHNTSTAVPSTNPSKNNSTMCKEDSRPITADMPTIFQLLTCYIRIVHLHSIFYTQVHDCIIAPLHKRELPLAPIFPGMHVGGVPLDDFRNFQIKLLLQISTHVLGEIETALGLPDGYRISKKNPQSHGILEASVSVQFVEMTMRENGRTGQMGIERDRVKSIRDKLGRLRSLLKGTINI